MEHNWQGGLYSQFLAATLKSYKDDQSRIRVALKEFYTVTIASPHTVFVDESNKKSRVKSNELRENGNKLYQKSADNCIKAWQSYSESIAFAPIDSLELALAYANRSAILFRLKRFAACANDALFALESNLYPKDKRPKVHIRRVESLAMIKSPDLKQAFTDGFSWIQSTNLKDKKKIGKELKDAFLKHKINHEVNLKSNEPDKTFDSAFKKFQEHPESSSLLKVHIEENGKIALVAKKDIKPGKILMTYRPYVTALDLSKIYIRCSECLKEIWSGIPCPHCAFSFYCSEKCRDNAWEEYHSIECAVLKFLGLECGSTRVLLKLIIKAKKEVGGLKKLLQLVKDIDESNCDFRTCLDAKGNVQNTFKAVYCGAKLSTKDRNTHKVVMCSRITYILAAETKFFGTKIDPEKICKLVAITKVTDILLQIGMASAMVVSMQTLINENDEELSTFAWEISAWNNLSRHSCVPNAITLNMKMTPVAFCSSFMKEGDMLTFPYYNMSYTNTCKHYRQETLTSKGITCKCVACVENWPTIMKDLPPIAKRVPRSSSAAKKLRKFFQSFDRYLSMADNPKCKDKTEAMEFLSEFATFCVENSRTPTQELLEAEERIMRIFFFAVDRAEIPIQPSGFDKMRMKAGQQVMHS